MGAGRKVRSFFCPEPDNPVTGYLVQPYSSLGDECTGLDLGAGRKGGSAQIRDPLQTIVQHFSLSSHKVSTTESRGADIAFSTGAPKGDKRGFQNQFLGKRIKSPK